MTQHNTDHQLKEWIESELAWTPAVSAEHIGVAVNDGAVTLSGQVKTYPEKYAAVRAALRVRGVAAVADEIAVHSDWAPRQDADIAREAARLLEHTVFAPPGAVTAAVHDHIVTLTGTVTWNYQREAIRQAVAALPGVHGVTNSIALMPKTTISSADAVEKIAAALRRNAEVDAEHVHVDVSGSTITLSGEVSSWAELRQAAHAAWSTPGVMHVSNHLRVRS